MNKQTYNEQAILQYLLGSLSEAESEQFDELSFTDDEFAEALKAAEKDLVDAYVHGGLTGTSLERFKTYYLASPLRREKVKFAQGLQLFAEKNSAVRAAKVGAEYPAQAAAKQKAPGWFSALRALTVPRLALQWGFAALALAFLIAGSWLLFENGRLRRQVSQMQARRDELSSREQELQKELDGQHSTSTKTAQELAQVRQERERLEQALKQEEERRLANEQRAASRKLPPAEVSIASFILTPQMRGVEKIPVVSIPAKTDYVHMQLELEPNDYPAYRVALLAESSNQILWRSGELRAQATGDNKTLSLNLRAGLLRPGVYVLRVTGVTASGEAEMINDYPFKVVK